jgi:hypothetical protein
MTEFEFRKTVKSQYPHVKIKIKTVSFSDLARVSKKVLTVEGEKDHLELKAINDMARELNIVPDISIRFYQEEAITMIEELGRLVGEGYDLRQIQYILKGKD